MKAYKAGQPIPQISDAEATKLYEATKKEVKLETSSESSSEGMLEPEASPIDGTPLAARIKSVIGKAIIAESRVQTVHHLEASASSDAVKSIQQNLPQIVDTLLKMQKQAELEAELEAHLEAELGAHTIVEAPLVDLLCELRSALDNVQWLARQSPNDIEAEKVQRLSKTIESILVGIRKHESDIPMVSGMLEPEASPGWGSYQKESDKKRTSLPFPTQGPPLTTASDLEEDLPVARERAASGAGKPLPFIRPADIYKRMEEEKMAEKQGSPLTTASDLEEDLPVARERAASGAGKPLPFVRPADIYRLMQEAKMAEKQGLVD